MKKIYSVVCLIFIAKLAFTQPTLPLPYSLAVNNYSFTLWDSLSAVATYPANMVFHYTISSEKATYNHLAEGARNYDCPYNLQSRNRILGFGDSGFAFIATSSAQYNDCAGIVTTADSNRYVGDAVLAVSSIGKTNVQVKWTGVVYTIGDGSGDPTVARQATVRLQYRIGATGTYTDALNGTDTVECNSTGKAAKTAVSLGTTLPASCNNQPLVYLRWVYFALPISGTKGTRPEILVDDIMVGTNVLPVNLLSFAVTNANGAAALTWKTANEINFSRFEIERSSTGSSYTKVATVAAKGSGSNTYTITDKTFAAGTNEYRLKMINIDGSFTYSNVVTFTVGAKGNLSITPNPATDKFTLTHPQASANSSIAIYSYDGRKIASYPVTTGAVQTLVNVSNFAKGNYLLVFTSGNQKMTIQLSKN